MAVYTYGLTADDVQVPGVDLSQITATSRVKTTHVTGWIQAGAGQLNGALRAAGITASADMGDDAHEACKNAVLQFVAWKVAYVMGMMQQAESSRLLWEGELARVANAPRILGDSYADGLVLAVDGTTDEGSDNWDFTGFGSKW